MINHVTDQIKSYLESVALSENVREWMVIVTSGNYNNQRVVYSTDKKDKAEERFYDFRDRYPDHTFRLMTKTSFRNMYHRFPEYMPQETQDKIFGVKEKPILKNLSREKLVYNPKDVQVVVKPTITKNVQVDVPKPQSTERLSIKRFYNKNYSSWLGESKHNGYDYVIVKDSSLYGSSRVNLDLLIEFIQNFYQDEYEVSKSIGYNWQYPCIKFGEFQADSVNKDYLFNIFATPTNDNWRVEVHSSEMPEQSVYFLTTEELVKELKDNANQFE